MRNKKDMKDLREARTRAVAAAFPEMRSDKVDAEIEKFYRGKSTPTQTKVRRVLRKAGLL